VKKGRLSYPCSFYFKFSGFSLEKRFASLFGATSLALMTESSVDKLVHLPSEDLTQFISKKGESRFKESAKVVEVVMKAVRESNRLRPVFFFPST